VAGATASFGHRLARFSSCVACLSSLMGIGQTRKPPRRAARREGGGLELDGRHIDGTGEVTGICIRVFLNGICLPGFC
jgi:hypothetical protein